MLDLKSQSQLADSTAAMMRACALALTQSLNASTSHGLRFWSQVLQPLPAGPVAGGDGAPSAAIRGWLGHCRRSRDRNGPDRPPPRLPARGWVSLLAWQRLARLSVVIPAFWPLLDLERRASARTRSRYPPPCSRRRHSPSYRSAGGHASTQVVAPRGQRPA